MQERHVATQCLCDQLTDLEVDCICAAILFDMMHLLVICMNRGLLIVLAKRWHSETCPFHLAMRDMPIILEDIQRILHIFITEELVSYDRLIGEVTLQQVFPYLELEVDDGSVAWEDISDLYEPLQDVLSGIVGRLLCIYWRSHVLAVGWGQVIERMASEGTRHVWGSCVLDHLYRDLHEVVYHEITSLGEGITLLHIWAWEHLPITRPMYMRFRAIDQPYVYVHRYDDTTPTREVGVLTTGIG